MTALYIAFTLFGACTVATGAWALIGFAVSKLADDREDLDWLPAAHGPQYANQHMQHPMRKAGHVVDEDVARRMREGWGLNHGEVK